jgi:H+-translocating NAD(P) transhydrogenase subunit alpha
MTGELIITLYLFTLAAFLGLDVIRKVPPTLYGALATGMGATAALAVAVALPAADASSRGVTAVLTVSAVAIATTGVIGGLLRTRRALHDGAEKGRGKP